MTTTEFIHYNPSLDRIIGICGICLGVYTIIANIAVLLIISRFVRRTNSDIIFAHIAVTDVVGGFDAIFAFVLLLTGRKYFDFYFIDDLICQFTAITWCVFTICAPFMLALTSFGRFLAVFLPHSYDKVFSKRTVILCLSVIWLWSSLGGTMHLYKLENTRMEPSWGYCDYRLIEIYTEKETRIIVILMYSIPLSLSSFFLVLFNTAVSLKLIKAQMDARKRSAALRRKTSVARGLSTALSLNLAIGNTKCAKDVKAQGRDNSSSYKSSFGLALPQEESESDIELSGQRSEIKENIMGYSIITDRDNCVEVHVSSKTSSDQTSAHSPSGGNPQKRPTNHGGQRRRKERNIILVTFLFSVNFVTWNFIILYYYFYYIIEPKRGVFTTMAKGNKLVLTYLNGWFYYATFMTSCVNPIIHFVCNSKMRNGFSKLFSKS